MVSVMIEAAPAPGQTMGIYFNFDFKSCAPGENCADSFGPTSQPNPSVPSSTPDSSVPSSTPDSSTPSSSTPISSSPNAPSQATTTIPVTTTVPATTTTVPAPTSTVPPPALATVQALPAAPTPIIADATISTGEEITVSFGGFTPFEFVQLIVASTPQVIGSGYANAQGVVTLSGNLPSNLASGNHTLAVFAPVSGVGFTQPITVSQPLLPATGSDGQNNLYVIAMLLFVLGIVVRRTSTVITNK
jgi:LPXTG-motif cell wall-anchored protein